MAGRMNSPIRRRGMAAGGTNTGLIIALVVGAVVLVLGCLGTILLAVMLPAIGTARESVLEGLSQSNLRKIELERYGVNQDVATDADPDLPEFTVEFVRTDRGLSGEALASPFGPVPDGGEDYWLHPETNVEAVASPERAIAAYDRAMYATHHSVAVIAFDGHTVVVPVEEFEQWVEEPANEGVDFNVPTRANNSPES